MKLKTEDITVLKKRLARLAAEKSRIELLLNMLLKLNSASDLEGVINHGLRVIVEVIGATNACLVVSEGGQYVVTDAFGQNERLESAVDPDIAGQFPHGPATVSRRLRPRGSEVTLL